MERAAVAALTGDPDKAFARRSRGIDFVIDQRAGRVTDSEASPAEAMRHLGLLFVARRARSQPLIEGTNLTDRIGAKGPVSAAHAAHFEHAIAVIGNGQ